MKLALAAFRGEMPIIDERLLPEQNAQAARNVFLRRGTLKPAHAPAPLAGLPFVVAPSTIYRYPHGNNGAGYWMVWGGSKQVDVVKSLLANDAWSRVYWTGDGYPKMGGIAQITAGAQPYPSSSYRLGIPAPASAPVATVPGDRVGVDDQPITAVQASYVVTLISSFGEEGPPSPPSTAMLRWDMVDDAPAGGNLVLALPPIPSGPHNIVSKRIYRAETAGVFQEVATLPAATGTYIDNIPSESLGVSMPSLEWDMPDTRMVGLTALPGGFMAGYFDNTLCFSEAFRPHAWPVSYQIAIPEKVVGIAAIAGGLVVATNGRPHMITGSSPAGMADSLLDELQPCVSRRSLVDMGEYAVYASPGGLVAVGGGEAKLLTEQVISKEQWQALRPETIHAYRYDGRYLAFYQGGCFSFTPGDGFEFYDISASGGWYDLDKDTLCLIQGNSIVGWEKGAAMPMRWRSKVYEMPPGVGAFSCAKVIARGYPVTLRLLADGEIAAELAIEDKHLVRLPPGYADARDWEIEIEGTREVQSVQVATSATEIV